MFKFLFGRVRQFVAPTQLYAVYYTLGDGTFTLKANVPATSEYEANRYFDRESPVEYRRVAGQTRLIT